MGDLLAEQFFGADFARSDPNRSQASVQQLAAHLRCQLKLSVRSLDICCASGTLHKKSPDRSTQFFRLSSSNSCFL